jgi:hypothetical protein
LVRDDDAVAGLCENRDLVFPAIPHLRESVQQDDGLPVCGAGFDDVEPDAVHEHIAMGDVGRSKVGHGSHRLGVEEQGRARKSGSTH